MPLPPQFQRGTRSTEDQAEGQKGRGKRKRKGKGRAQPYKRDDRELGPTLSAIVKGGPGFLPNPQDRKRAAEKKRKDLERKRKRERERA